MPRNRRWIAAIAALALLLGGCGAATKSASQSLPPQFGERAATTSQAQSDAAAPAAPAGGAAGASKAAEGNGAAGVGQGSAQASSDLGRKIIYRVDLDMTVEDVQGSLARVTAIAESNGGLIADSNFSQVGDQRRASITIRVPVGRYQDVLGQLRGLATKVESERTTGNDVTEEFTDQQARLRNLEATEQQLLTFLAQAKNVQEVLQVQDRLNTVRGEIERVKGRINLLNRLTDLATIQVQLRPTPPLAKPAPKPGPITALRDGWEASLEVVSWIGLRVLALAAFSWWLVPFIALGAWLLRRSLRRRGAGAMRPRANVPPHQPAAGATP